MKRKSILWSISIILLLVSISCVSISIPRLPALDVEKQPSGPTINTHTNDNEIKGSEKLPMHQNAFVELYQKADPGVVTIRTTSDAGEGLGTGFVLDTKGRIITNYHVVKMADDLEIDFPSGFKTRAKVLGTDSDSDIAVLQLNKLPDNLTPLPLGDSDKAKVGQIVVAIGNPRGLDSTMTTGIISAKGRTMSSLHHAPQGGAFTAGGIIQTDAAINPGNSGGPLLTLDGEVIGVNVAIQTSRFDSSGQPVNSGIGFAVPINIVKRVAPVLIEKGKYEYPYLGIRSMSEITLKRQEELGLPQSFGVYIIQVTPDSPAEKAGLRGGKLKKKSDDIPAGGDLIIAIDDHPVRNFNDLVTYLIHNKQPGDQITLTILRNNKQMNIDLTLGLRP